MKNLNLGDLKLNYQDQGSGYPVVLIHGLGSDHTIWEGIIPHLENNYHVLALDLRGHGGSSKNPGPYSLELFSQDVYGFLETLDICQAHFMGHSMGGAVLQELAIQKSKMFGSLTLISSFAYIDQQLKDVLLELLRILREEGYIAFFNKCLKLANTPQFIETHKEFFLEIQNVMAKTISIPSLEQTINACLNINFLNSLGMVKTPTLIIAGEEDVFVPVEHGIKINNSIPNSKLEIMPSASHNMLLEQPVETYKLINKFFNINEF
ncbi:MAG: alpha/beta hydrolase [Methanobacterium sp.]|nr:alpha/beta hydrolase [Methanobacterium sp.]